MLISTHKSAARLGVVAVAIALCAGTASQADAQPVKPPPNVTRCLGIYKPGEIVTVKTEGKSGSTEKRTVCGTDGQLHTIAPGDRGTRVIDPDTIVHHERAVGTAPPLAPIH